MMDFKIHSLAFTSCSRKYVVTLQDIFPTFVTVHVALHLQSTQFAILFNCFFYDNDGTALVVSNTNITLAGNIVTHNSAQGGCCGAILTYSINITDNVVLSSRGINNFITNSAGYGGGAIYASNLLSVESITSSATQQVLMVAQSAHMTTLHFGSMEQTTSSITQQVFWVVQSTHQTTLHLFSLEPKLHQQLSRCLGGGIYTLNNAVLTFNGTSNFTNNSAGISSGGAIYSSDNALLSFNGIDNFINNSADVLGGAIYTSQDAVLNFSEITNYINCSVGYGGGAIYFIKQHCT